MQAIAESELILTREGAAYHLNLHPENIADTVITVGDPERVRVVSKYFDKVDFITSHREFVTHTGRIGKKRLSVLSTGIGTDNIDIVLNELDALVNIDFSTRTIKEKISSLRIIRLGTCGGLQKDIPTGGIVVSSLGIGMDNLLSFYKCLPPKEEENILHAFLHHTGLQHVLKPYIAGASPLMLEKFKKEGFHHGITVTCPGFYAPQGRVLRGMPAFPKLIDQLTAFKSGAHRILNFEMETAGIYGLGRLLAHECLSVSTIVANRASGEFSKDSSAAIDNMIKRSLEIIVE